MVPVENFVTDSFEALIHTDPRVTSTIHLKLASTADVEAMRARFEEIVEGEDDITDASEALLPVTEQDALGQTLRFQFPSPDPTTGLYTECRIREALIAHAVRLETETGRRTLPQGAAADAVA